MKFQINSNFSTGGLQIFPDGETEFHKNFEEVHELSHDVLESEIQSTNRSFIDMKQKKSAQKIDNYKNILLIEDQKATSPSFPLVSEKKKENHQEGKRLSLTKELLYRNINNSTFRKSFRRQPSCSNFHFLKVK